MSNRTLVPALVLMLSVLLLTSFTHAQLSGTLLVSFIDLGQGDSILLNVSDGTHVLVDAGQPWAGPTVVAYLQAQDIDHIDVVVMSHGHANHIGGLIELFRSDISVGSVIYNGQPCTTATCARVWAKMEKRSLTPTPAVPCDHLHCGSVEPNAPL